MRKKPAASSAHLTFSVRGTPGVQNISGNVHDAAILGGAGEVSQRAAFEQLVGGFQAVDTSLSVSLVEGEGEGEPCRADVAAINFETGKARLR
jgi:hypothetical protein